LMFNEIVCHIAFVYYLILVACVETEAFDVFVVSACYCY